MVRECARLSPSKPQSRQSSSFSGSFGGAAAQQQDLVSMIRRDGTIYAHELCRICDIKPNTLRMSRMRGKGPPSHRVSANRVVISLRDAAAWLQATGRYGAAIQLAEWLDQKWRDAALQHRAQDVPALPFDF